MSRHSKLRNRIAALDRAINPRGSLRWKLATLTDEQRTEYARWKKRCAAHEAEKPGVNLYERCLDGDMAPELRYDIQILLFGEAPRFTVDMTSDQVAELYSNYLSRI